MRHLTMYVSRFSISLDHLSYLHQYWFTHEALLVRVAEACFQMGPFAQFCLVRMVSTRVAACRGPQRCSRLSLICSEVYCRASERPRRPKKFRHCFRVAGLLKIPVSETGLPSGVAAGRRLPRVPAQSWFPCFA